MNFESSEDINELLADSGSEYEPDSDDISDNDFDLGFDDRVAVKRNRKTGKENKTPRSSSVSKRAKRDAIQRKPQASSSSMRNGDFGNRRESPPKKISKKRLEKPFNQLMQDVVFTISGYQNPYRSDLRNKALAMGAKYKADWDDSCTHLLCAFPNTPKFNQVLGSGKIVTKEWFETCFSRRMRLPWRRYALHPADKKVRESDEEIYEAVVRTPSPVDSRRRANTPCSSGEDTEEEIERVKQAQLEKNQKKPSLKKHSGSYDKERKENCDSGMSVFSARNRINNNISVCDAKSKAEPNSEDVFDEDTDNEDNTIKMVKSPIPNHMYLPSLPSVFENITFFVDKELPDEERKRVKRYIVASKGSVLENIDDDSGIEYVISESFINVKKLKEKYPDIIGLSPEWVWRAHDEGRLIPSSSYEV